MWVCVCVCVSASDLALKTVYHRHHCHHYRNVAIISKFSFTDTVYREKKDNASLLVWTVARNSDSYTQFLTSSCDIPINIRILSADWLHNMSIRMIMFPLISRVCVCHFCVLLLHHEKQLMRNSQAWLMWFMKMHSHFSISYRTQNKTTDQKWKTIM